MSWENPCVTFSRVASPLRFSFRLETMLYNAIDDAWLLNVSFLDIFEVVRAMTDCAVAWFDSRQKRVVD